MSFGIADDSFDEFFHPIELLIQTMENIEDDPLSQKLREIARIQR